MNELKYGIQNAIDRYEYSVSYNIIKAFGVIFHEERHSNKFPTLIIDDLVNEIFRTTEIQESEYGISPKYDETKINPMIEKIRIALGKPAKTPW
jgi:hypothetical protein